MLLVAARHTRAAAERVSSRLGANLLVIWGVGAPLPAHPVLLKTGCGPFKHQPPALTGTSLTHSTSSVLRSGACRAASSSKRSALSSRSRVHGPL